MDILLKQSQLESSFNKLMKKYENPIIEDFDLSYWSEFYKYLPEGHNVKLFFETDIDALPEENNWYVLYDPYFTHKKVKFINKEINEEDFPILYLTNYFKTEESMLGDLFKPLFKQWFEKTFNLPVKTIF